jgi:4'-phosphopantetheinyl transferase EntD
VLEVMLPGAVAVAEAFDDPPEATLFPEEEALISRAVDKRRREFATARHCARQAFARLGLPPTAILPGPRGAPQWPLGVVGSMTHCDGYRAAAIGRAADVTAIGVDAEPHAELPDGVLETIALPEERAQMRELGKAVPGVHWGRLLFSAKESVYKAWFPLTGRWLDFAEASIVFDPFDGTFDARLLVPGPQVGGRRLSGFDGRWMVGKDLVLTAITVPARTAPSIESDPPR